jgi:flagellar motor switch/type III secretory pathway protein FliN
MPPLGPDQLPAVLAACQAGIGEIVEALARNLDLKAEVALGEAGNWKASAPPAGCEGPGLVLALTIGNTGALVLLPEAGGLLPDWYAEPDATGQSKLTTLAQELGMLMLPEDQMPVDFAAGRVGNLKAACQRSGVGDGAALVPLTLSTASSSVQLSLVWPAVLPTQALAVGADSGAPAGAAASAAAEKASEKPAPQAQAAAAAPKPQPAPVQRESPSRTAEPQPLDGDLEALPTYLRSRLRVQVPVVVTLASKRQAIGRILEIGPGSIIQFDKLCDEMLDLSVGNHCVAQGEAVKIGEKFGLRITSLTLPEERFVPLTKDPPSRR